MRPPRLLLGPHPALPRPLDAVSDRWWRMAPRVRTLSVLLLLTALVAVGEHRVRVAEARWGGTPRVAHVAAADLPVGAAATDLRRVLLPPGAVPPAAVHDVPAGAVLALALPAGAVLTQAHLDPQGPAAGLAADLRAMPLPVEAGWGIAAGGWVDVWVLGTEDAPARQVAGSRPVLDVLDDGGRRVALIGLAGDEVGAVTAGLAVGQVLLVHAPPPRG